MDTPSSNVEIPLQNFSNGNNTANVDMAEPDPPNHVQNPVPARRQVSHLGFYSTDFKISSLAVMINNSIVVGIITFLIGMLIGWVAFSGQNCDSKHHATVQCPTPEPYDCPDCLCPTHERFIFPTPAPCPTEPPTTISSNITTNNNFET